MKAVKKNIRNRELVLRICSIYQELQLKLLNQARQKLLPSLILLKTFEVSQIQAFLFLSKLSPILSCTSQNISFQDSGQRYSTASLDIVTADAFSIILDFLYSGRLALNRSNVIEVMSAASYLQMTDLVNFCKGYIRSSLEICNKEKERNTEKENQAQDGGMGPADSGTPPATNSSGAGAAKPHSEAAEADIGSGLGPETVTSARTPLSIPVATTPGTSRDMDSDYHSREEFASGSEGQKGHMDQTNLSSSSSSVLTPELVNPKIEYDPDEELMESPDTKDLASYPGPSLHNPHHSRLLPPSPSPSNERSPLGYSPSFNARQLMEMLARGEGPSPLGDRVGQRFNQGLGSSTGGGRMDEGLGFVGSSIMEIQSDWLGEDTGNWRDQYKLMQMA